MGDIANVDVPEIEVTPEMIEAVLDAWADYDCRFDSKEDALRQIFIAMLTRSRNGVGGPEENSA